MHGSPARLVHAGRQEAAAGSFDRDTELELWFSGLGKVRLEFKANADIRQLGQMIAGYVL
ncbi:hypothetical protein AMIS_44730 [Actinoplanes missouriensis 431]|uniref:Bacterial Pleckstrin homology domain-containing protein n=1 Tax=Actinoplanes missouriensis (strain ATCC 14538 / DSM 43046 / CBS 188.64 / JCM 3121 / NBRC 102363 / NCIMB 12654 / NRRL B-3342 / UNCC 431) TaxID=512565 RepID=I0H9K6_ACTM4|nr:PH domain-containing protein [Actinoplanes missouriensis]BAL89693.1 hypothetical protein AMIS_44730 [Actinoplanes missouriensis 431]